jgi:hypothetical protein
MAQPTPQDVHIDAALSNVSVAYKNGGYIADKIFPLVPVDKQSDYYFVWTKDFWFRDHVKLRAPGSSYAEGGLQLSNAQYVCINKGLSFPLPLETLQNQDAAVDLETAGAEWLADQFALDREIALATAIFDASAWTSYTTLTGTNEWNDYANSDPIKDIETGKEAIKALTGVYPNTLVMGAQVWDKMKFHPDFLDVYKYSSTAILSPDQVGKVFGIDNMIIGQAIKNTAGEGVAFAGSYIWDKNALLMYTPSSPGLRTSASGYCFVWKQNGFVIPISRVEQRDRKRDLLLADHAFIHKVVGADLGYEIINAVA